MKFVKCSEKTFLQKANSKHVICFGASNYFNVFAEKIGNNEWMDNINCFVDNNKFLQGKSVTHGRRSWQIVAPDYLRTVQDVFVVVATREKNAINIGRQLQEMHLSDSLECCALCLVGKVQEYDNTALKDHKLNTNYNIEKVIHCCWFSGEEKPEKYQQCIDSWKKYCPDYIIKEWNSYNYDLSKNRYMKQAYDKKMWAYVSDYARLDLIYDYGGIYFDMDVEILRNIDELLKYRGFFSFDDHGCIDLGSGFGAEKGQKLIKRLLDVYENIEFIGGEGKIDFKKTIPQPTRLFPVFESWGYRKEAKTQIIDDIVIFSPDYFRVIADLQHENRRFKGREFAIHWHHAGWFDEQTYKEREMSLAIEKELQEIYHQ